MKRDKLVIDQPTKMNKHTDGQGISGSYDPSKLGTRPRVKLLSNIDIDRDTRMTLTFNPTKTEEVTPRDFKLKATKMTLNPTKTLQVTPRDSKLNDNRFRSNSDAGVRKVRNLSVKEMIQKLESRGKPPPPP